MDYRTQPRKQGKGSSALHIVYDQFPYGSISCPGIKRCCWLCGGRKFRKVYPGIRRNCDSDSDADLEADVVSDSDWDSDLDTTSDSDCDTDCDLETASDCDTDCDLDTTSDSDCEFDVEFENDCDWDADSESFIFTK